jgi:hypothetical protein
LDEEDARRVEAALLSSTELAALGRSMARTLRPLESWQVDPPPAGLADRILGRITDAPAESPADGEAAPIPFPTETRSGTSPRPYVAVRELVAVAACIVIFVGIFLPAYYQHRSNRHKFLCANNMRELTEAAGVYSQAHAGMLPFAGAAEDASWLPVKTPGVKVASNRRHPYVLIKLGYIRDPRVYVCPSRGQDIAMVASRYEDFDDFPEPQNISYAYQNLNAGPIRITPNNGRLAFLSDQNPLFDGGRFHPPRPSMINSRAHGEGKGQNVAYVDGSVSWAKIPTVGIGGDDIFRAGNITRYTGTEAPQSDCDSFLIP